MITAVKKDFCFVVSADCLNGENDTMNDISQTDDACREITTDLPKKSDDKLNADDYFSIHCDREVLKFYYGVKLQKQRVKLQKQPDEQPRILDMCFVKLKKKLYLVYIDADNMRIVKRDISNDCIEPVVCQLTLEPNRLAKINNSTIGVIYKKKFDILIYNVATMEKITTYSIAQGDIMESTNGIQGILALSKTDFILSDKIHLHRYKVKKGKTDTVVNKFATSVDKFDTARRLTHVTVSQHKCQDVIFIADENDKKLTSIGKTTGEYINDHKGFKRGLQNVRAIGATKNRVYAATSAGIAVFPHNEGVFVKFKTEGNDGKDFRMLLDYKYHVEHTRGLCIHLDKGYIYMGLSCVIKQNDVIFLFRFKPNDTFQ